MGDLSKSVTEGICHKLLDEKLRLRKKISSEEIILLKKFFGKLLAVEDRHYYYKFTEKNYTIGT